MKYAEEYYVTQNGEIIKLAAICPIKNNSSNKNEIEVYSIDKTDSR